MKHKLLFYSNTAIFIPKLKIYACNNPLPLITKDATVYLQNQVYLLIVTLPKFVVYFPKGVRENNKRIINSNDKIFDLQNLFGLCMSLWLLKT